MQCDAIAEEQDSCDAQVSHFQPILRFRGTHPIDNWRARNRQTEDRELRTTSCQENLKLRST